MRRSNTDLRKSEAEVLAILREMQGWTCAKAIAARMGWPWRIVARALRRIARTGEVEARVEEVRCKKSLEQRWIYKRTIDNLADYPNWLMPKVPPHMRDK